MDIVTGTICTPLCTRSSSKKARSPFPPPFLQMATSSLSRWCPVAWKTTRRQCTLASSWHTILCAARCSASCAVSSTSSRIMGSSVPVCSNRFPPELMRLADRPDRTLAGWRDRVYSCVVCQVEFSFGGGSIVHLWWVCQLQRHYQDFKVIGV